MDRARKSMIQFKNHSLSARWNGRSLFLLSFALTFSVSFFFFSCSVSNEKTPPTTRFFHSSICRGAARFNSQCPGAAVAMNPFSTFRRRIMAVRLELANGAVLIVARFNSSAAKKKKRKKERKKNRPQQEEGRETGGR